MGVGQAIALYVNRQRVLPQAAKLRAQPVADDSVNHKCSVHFAGGSKHFAAGQVPPFIRADDAAGLDPAVVRAQVGGEVGPGGSLGPHLLGASHGFDNLGANAIDFEEVGPHALQHNLVVDVNHVGVPNLAAVDHVGHLHARAQFVGLRLHGEDANLAGLEIVHDLFRKIGQRAGR